MELDLSGLKDQDLAVLYAGIWLTSARGRPVGIGQRSKEALDAALWRELERRRLTTAQAAQLAEQATA